MPKLEHQTILAHIARGELDEALRLVEKSDATDAPPGVSVLVPLARALLAEGRDLESLAILERASAESVFGGNLNDVATEVGLQDSPLLRAVEARRAERAATEMSDELLKTTVDGRAGRDVDGTIETDEDLIGETDEVALPEVSSPPTAPFSDTQPENGEFVDEPTTEDGDPENVQSTATIDESREVIEELDSEDQRSTDPLSRQDTPTEDMTKPMNLEALEGAPRSTETASSREGGDTDGELEEARETWTKPIDLGNLATPPDHESAPIDPLDSDETRKIECPESLLGEELSQELQAVAAEARVLRASSLDRTDKLQIPDIEVVGFFSAGVGTSRSGEASGQGRSNRHCDGSSSNGSESHAELAATLETERALHYHKTYETTEKILTPEARQHERKSGKRPKMLVQLLLVAAALLGLATLIGFIRHHRLEATELERVRSLRADDTFASHRLALTVLSKLSKRYPDSESCAEFAIESVLMWGRFGLEREHLDASKAALEGCAAENEPSITARALVRYYESDVGKALHLAKQGVARFPQSPRLRTVLGLALEARDLPVDAAEEYTAARRIDPGYLPAALFLARLHRRAGDRGEARVALDQLRRQSPRHIEAQVEELLLALDRAAGSSHAEALRALESQASELGALAQSQPPSIAGRVALMRGRLALAQRQVDRAGILFNKARRLGRLDPEAAYHISRGLLLAGDLVGAAETAEHYEAGSLDKALRRATLYVALGRPGAARHVLSQPLLREGHGTQSPASRRDAASRKLRLEAECAKMKGEPLTGLSLLEGLAPRETDDAVAYTRARFLALTGQHRLASQTLRAISTPPWSVCARARASLLEGAAEQATELLAEGEANRAPCGVRLRAMAARELGDEISEISSLRSLLRLDPRSGDRVALARAVWRERGTQAALSELAPLVAAPPTGLEPLLRAADLLADMRADDTMTALLESARRAKAPPDVLATSRARYERTCQRPQAAYRAIEGASSGSAPTLTLLEKAAILIAVERTVDASRLLGDIHPPVCSDEWGTYVALRARIIAAREGMAGADLYIGRALRECPTSMAGRVTQKLQLERVRLALAARALNEAKALLRNVSRRPRNAQIPYLTGRIAESEGTNELAVRAYERALELDEAHIPSLERLIILTDSARIRRQLDDLRGTREESRRRR